MATNSSSTKELFQDRLSFKLGVTEEEPLVFYDHYFAENIMYGAIDGDSNTIIPNETNLVTIKGQGSDVFRTFDFVSDMFNRVKANIRLKAKFNQIEKDNKDIINLNVKRAYEPPLREYSKYFKAIIRLYEEEEITRVGIINITSFEQYVKHFFEFIKNNFSRASLTLGHWLRSRSNSIFSSGLALSISETSISDDSPKAQFVLSNCFSYFKKICLNEGFHLLENSPWVMVANISSPAFINSIEDYSYINTNNIIVNNDIYYNITYNNEYKYIKGLLIDSYNSFAQSFPVYINHKIYGKRKTINQVKYRELYPYNGRYIESFWLDFYTELKNIEEPLLNKGQMEEIKDYRKKIQNLFDKDSALSYINIIFKDSYKREAFAYKDLYKRFLSSQRTAERERGITRGTISGGY